MLVDLKLSLRSKMAEKKPQIIIEDAELLYENFSGKEKKWNLEGQRNFCVYLDEDTAKQMKEDGWNVRLREGREEGEPDKPYLQISVGYQKNPPHIVLIASTGRTLITEENVSVLDMIDMETC